MSQYADDRDVDDEARRDIEEMIAEKRDPMCGPHKPDITIPDRITLDSSDMMALRTAVLFMQITLDQRIDQKVPAPASGSWHAKRDKYAALYDKIAEVSRLIEPPF